MHPSDVVVLESIDESQTRYEEDSGTVFLARGVMDRLAKLTMVERRRSFGYGANPAVNANVKAARRVSRYSYIRP